MKTKDYDKKLASLNEELEKATQRCKNIEKQIEEVEAEKQQSELDALLKDMKAQNISINEVRELVKNQNK